MALTPTANDKAISKLAVNTLEHSTHLLKIAKTSIRQKFAFNSHIARLRPLWQTQKRAEESVRYLGVRLIRAYEKRTSTKDTGQRYSPVEVISITGY